MRNFVPFLAGLALCNAVLAQFTEPRPEWWITNGSVRAVAVDTASGTVALGGSFSYTGPNNPFGAEIDLTTSSVRADRPRINGVVRSAVSDGAGGWYIGGLFSQVGGQPRSNLAHILADGSVGSWAPSTNSTVADMLMHMGKVYLAGSFGQVNGSIRSRLAVVDAITGTLDPFWQGASNSPGTTYNSLNLVGDTLYIGGSISALTVNGIPYVRSNLLACSITSGNVLPWAPQASAAVTDLWAADDTLFMVGNFTSIDGTPRNRCAAVSTAGALLPWDPQVSGVSVSVTSLAIGPDRIYLGGAFSAVQGQPQANLATVDRITGAPLVQQPAPPSGGVLGLALSTDGSHLFACGNFLTAAGQPRWNLAAYHTGTWALTPLDIRCSGSPSHLTATAAGLFVGGTFTSCGGRAVNNLALLDLSTGSASAQQPALAFNGEVRSLAFTNGRWFVGGSFTAPWQRLLSLDASTLSLDPWNPEADGPVNVLVAEGSDLFAAGAFTQIGGAPRNGLALLSTTADVAQPWDPAPDGPVRAISVSGQDVHVGGGFNTIGGGSRRGAALLDRTSGAALGSLFDLDATGSCQALHRVDSMIYIGGHFSTFNGAVAAHLVRAHAGTGAVDTLFDAAGADSTIAAIVEQGNQVFIAGPFNQVGGQGRSGVAALDPATGALAPFDPALTAGPVLELIAANDLLLTAGGFTQAQGAPGRSLNVHRACTTTSWYTDADGDGRGDAGTVVLACDAPPGTVANGTDCDDADPTKYPGAACDDGDPFTANDVVDNACQCAGSTVRLAVKAFLGGPYGPLPNIMADGMRAAGLVPTLEPYTALGFAHQGQGGGESIAPALLNVTGNNAVVDWVYLEVRSSTNPSSVLATRSCLLQRDGDVVDLDGTSFVHLYVPTGEYHIALRHRNHLPVMTGLTRTLQPGIPAEVRFDLPGTATFGTNAQRNISGVMVLWAGDSSGNGQVKYAGGANDRDPVLVAIGGIVPTATTSGYLRTDITLDGVVKYTGPNNDRDRILQTVGGSVPTAVRNAQLP
ncbi:MAG: putative metal-binding motif-containing protein [Flavobacteriales bacterium]|nr:putative metal-binding motif-containing protein [Flavobacteriales bacterium]